MVAKKHQVIQAVTRKGEGVAIAMHRQAVSRADGATTEAIVLDFSDASVPDRRFAADAAWVEIGTDMTRILFAQFKGAGPQFEHVVVVRVPYVGARLFLKSMVDVADLARIYLKRFQVPASAAPAERSLPNQTFTLDANIFVAGFSGREACLDLYHTSPHVIAAIQKGAQDFRAEPVARVILTTSLLMQIHDSLHSSKQMLPADQSEQEL